MADTHNIIRLADIPRKMDRAAQARVRAIAAGENDLAYEAAIRDLENYPASTIEGVQAKFERLCTFLDDLEAGGWGITPEGWVTINQLRGGISEALARFASYRFAS